MATATVKNPTTERNKMIAAIVLGILALIAFYFAFGRGLFAAKTPTASSTPTPTRTPTPLKNPADMAMPSQAEQEFTDITTPVICCPGVEGAPDPGRNIFAFYEPPPPTPYSPTPAPPVVIKTPTPTPLPPVMIGFVTPQNVYAGSPGFKLEVTGDKFEPGMYVEFNQTQLPTTFVSPQKLVADVPAGMISGEGSKLIFVRSQDQTKYSNQFFLSVQAPPKPTFKYIGMIGRKRYNNDTAYFQESASANPFGARLNDIVGGRFRLISMSPAETVFEDTQLGFKHRIPIEKSSSAPSTGAATGPSRGTVPMGAPGFTPFNPNQQIDPNNCPPGIPCNGPVKPQQMNPPGIARPAEGAKTSKDDVDDNDN